LINFVLLVADPFAAKTRNTGIIPRIPVNIQRRRVAAIYAGVAGQRKSNAVPSRSIK